MLWARVGLDGGRGHFCHCVWQQTTPLKDAIKQWVTAPVLFVLTLVPSRRFRHLLTHKYTVASPHEVAAAYGCPSNSVRERPLHDCLCVHARRRQPPTIGEYRPIFCASRRKRRGRKRQSLRRSSFTAFCRLSRRFALLAARTIPVAGRSIRRRVARWTTPSPRSRNAATCHCPRTRSRRFPTSPALVRAQTDH